jgi:hypothetical protein
MSTASSQNPSADNWPALRQAALQLFDDLRNEYPMYGEAYFAHVQGLVNCLVRQSAPTTDAELQARLMLLGEVTLAAYRVREQLELGIVL